MKTVAPCPDCGGPIGYAENESEKTELLANRARTHGQDYCDARKARSAPKPKKEVPA
jgi:hypothetical protein